MGGQRFQLAAHILVGHLPWAGGLKFKVEKFKVQSFGLIFLPIENCYFQLRFILHLSNRSRGRLKLQSPIWWLSEVEATQLD